MNHAPVAVHETAESFLASLDDDTPAIHPPLMPRTPANQFVRQGNFFELGSANDVHRRLPPGTYSIGQTIKGFYLEIAPSFTEPPKLYGDTGAMARRIVRTYLDRDRNTGVLLCGEKGSGKSLTAKLASVYAAEHNIPTLLVNAPFHGGGFNEFLTGITQRVVVIFDEFEKVYYKREWQQGLLTLLDGTQVGNKLFVFTSNDPYAIEDHFKNRPGRVFYNLSFEGLTDEFIREFLTDRLNDKAQVDPTMVLCRAIGTVNFDMLYSLVEEMNRYNETAAESVRYLNVDMDVRAIKYRPIMVNAHGIEFVPLMRDVANPTTLDDDEDISVYIHDKDFKKRIAAARGENRDRDDDNTVAMSFDFGRGDLMSIDADGIITMKNDEGIVAQFKPMKRKRGTTKSYLTYGYA